MNEEELEETVNRLVATRYPYEVRAILEEIEDNDDLVIIVSAALARSVRLGESRGRTQATGHIRARLGL